MRFLANKLRSNAGASILLALAVVLVCTMVASIVLIAAATNVGKGMSVQQHNQAFYTVSSAAQLFIDDMEAEQPSAEISTTVQSYACQEVHPSYVHADANTVSEMELIYVTTNGATSPFMQVIEEALHAIDPTDETSSYTRDLSIRAPGMETVQATFVMDASYNIEVVFRCAVGGSADSAVKLSLAAISGEPVVTTKAELSDSHMDGWEYFEEARDLPWKETTVQNLSTGNYEPSSNEYGQSSEQLYNVVTTTTTINLAWGSPALSKGEAQ